MSDITLQSESNGARFNVVAGSNLHQRLSVSRDGTQFKPVANSSRSTMVGVGVTFKDGMIVRDAVQVTDEKPSADVTKPRGQSGRPRKAVVAAPTA